MRETNENLCETHIIGESTRERMVSSRTCPALTVEGIRLLGLSDARRDFCFIRLRPVIGQILVCIDGEGEVLVERNWTRCGPGQAYLTPPGALHAYRAVPDLPWHLCWVILDPESLEWPLFSLPDPALVAVDPRPLAATVAELYRESMGMAEPGVLHAWCRMAAIQARRIAAPEGADPRLLHLWREVQDNLAHPWSVEELASLAALSGEHLRRLCLAQHHRTPMRQVTFLRMRQAAALLASESYTVEAVARQVGYDNPYAFSTAFKRATGVPPSLYRHPAPPSGGAGE